MNTTNDGPLPRNRFHWKTQRWYPEKTCTVTSHKGSDGREGNAGKVAGLARPFVSSFDYALNKSYAVQQPYAGRENLSNQQREETYTEIDRFQARHALACAHSITVVEKDWSDDDNDHRSEIDAEHRESVSGILSGGEFASPLMGYVSGFPLHKIYATICKLKSNELDGDATNLASIRLSFEEFQALISTIGDGHLLSRKYLHKIFSSLPTYASSTTSVQAFGFYSYIVEHTYHPSLNRNVAMLFTAFAQDNDLIPLVSLHSRVVLVWAELHTFGNLRGEWGKLAQALEAVQKELLEDKLIVRQSLYLTPAEVRALFCSKSLLWNVMNSIDMEGGGRSAKKDSRQ